jgi:predicted nucleic acid-binding protein
MLKIVLDTSVLTSALRSNLGASHAVLRLVGLEQITVLATPALFMEYEAVLTRPEQLAVSKLTHASIFPYGYPNNF